MTADDDGDHSRCSLSCHLTLGDDEALCSVQACFDSVEVPQKLAVGVPGLWMLAGVGHHRPAFDLGCLCDVRLVAGGEVEGLMAGQHLAEVRRKGAACSP
jgi:hypothetical protein